MNIKLTKVLTRDALSLAVVDGINRSSSVTPNCHSELNGLNHRSIVADSRRTSRYKVVVLFIIFFWFISIVSQCFGRIGPPQRLRPRAGIGGRRLPRRRHGVGAFQWTANHLLRFQDTKQVLPPPVPHSQRQSLQPAGARALEQHLQSGLFLQG